MTTTVQRTHHAQSHERSTKVARRKGLGPSAALQHRKFCCAHELQGHSRKAWLGGPGSFSSAGLTQGTQVSGSKYPFRRNETPSAKNLCNAVLRSYPGMHLSGHAAKPRSNISITVAHRGAKSRTNFPTIQQESKKWLRGSKTVAQTLMRIQDRIAL